MSFAADLKDFASNFRDTYKTLHVSGRDELASEQAAFLREERDAKARGEAELNRGKGISALDTAEHTYSSEDTPTSGYNRRGKAPTFTSVNFDNTAPRLIADLQKETGIPQHAAEGFVGRLGAETGGFSTLQETSPTVPGSRGGFGYAQWTGPRRRAFERYTAANSLDPSSYEANKGFLIHELKNTGEGKVLGALRRSRDAQEAGNIVENQFLRPGIPHGRRGVGWVNRASMLGGRATFGLGTTPGPLPRRAALDIQDEETEPVVYAATGGVIPSGLERSLDTTESESAGSNPVTRDVMDAERSSVDENWDPRPLVDIEGARQAVAGGLKFGQRTLGLETHHDAVPGATRLNPDGVAALQTNAGAPTREEVAAVHKTVDPKGELPPELREIAGFNALQKFWTARGEPQKAERAAWQMLQAGKKAVSQYGALALAIDDPVKRAEVIAKAHNQFLPDGERLKITGKSGDGAKFELFDNKGQLTEKGVLAMDDMVKMATGMHDGTHYLQAMTQFATAAPNATDKRLEVERKAGEEYDATLEPEQRSDHLATLSDEQRQKFLAQPTRLQNQKTREWQRDRKQAFDEFKFDERMKKGAENLDRKEALDIAKFTTRYGMWEKTREQVMTQGEQKLAQLQAQEAGRNNRFDQSMEARRKRQQEIDQRILDKRTAGRDGAGVKLTPKEAAENRRTSAIDVAEDRGIAAIEEAVPLTPGGSEGTMTERRSRAVETEIAPIRAEAGYQRLPEKARDISVGDVDEIDKHIKAKMPNVAPSDQVWARRIATDISAAGGQKVLNTEAADYVISALNPRNPEPRVLPGGLVQLRPDLPPVRMTGESLIALAQLRQRAIATAKPTAAVRGQRTPALEVPFSASTYDDPRAVNRRRALDLTGR